MSLEYLCQLHKNLPTTPLFYLIAITIVSKKGVTILCAPKGLEYKDNIYYACRIYCI